MLKPVSRNPLRLSFALGALSAVILMLTLSTSQPQADVVILKDGYSIHGKLGDEKTVIFDAGTGQELIVKKANGFTTVDDGCRWTIFSAKFQSVGDVSDFNKFADYVVLTRKIYRLQSYPLPAAMVFLRQTEFGSDWRRTLTYNTPSNQPIIIPQQVVVLTPHYLRMDGVLHAWSCHYLTRELGFERIRKLLASHPDLVEKDGKLDLDKRTRIVRFLIQADWLSEAEEEIKAIEKALPTESKRTDELRKDIREIRLDRQVADIERAKESGRHGYALATLKKLPPKEELPRKLADKVLTINVEYDAKVRKFEDAKRYLATLKDEMTGANTPLRGAAEAILQELHMDTVNRLDTFVTLAAQLTRERKAGKKPLYLPEEIVAAGVSGWLQGQNSAQTKVEFALKLLTARDMALEYLRTEVSGKRGALLKAYEKDSNALPYDVLEKLISLLPPPAAVAKLPTQPEERKTEIIAGVAEEVKYVLSLPPEYQHGRPYPLLLVLPTEGQKAESILESLGDLPAKHGFVVAVMQRSGFQQGNTDSAQEHAAVTGLLRHLRRNFQIDSDRVFLFGYAEGATLAMDIASGHPDLFAGVVPMAPVPSEQFLMVGKYWTNFQNLPVYLVMGDRAGDTIRTVRRVYSEWMRLGYPALCISYKGRGNDWFGEELPYIFDWMARKSRVMPLPAVGAGDPFHTMRTTDSHFYWLSADEIDQNRLAVSSKKSNQNPAALNAKINEGNLITVSQIGLKQMTIWIGQGMIDFAKPVLIKVDQREVFKKVITPKISVLLEDLYERGDRQRPALQRIELTDLHRVIKANSQ